MNQIEKVILSFLHHRRYIIGLLLSIFLLSGCQILSPGQSGQLPDSVVSTLPIPHANHEYTIDAFRNDVIGNLQIISARHEDTLSDIARRFNLGYEEIVSANPNVDPWLPGEGTRIVIPTQFVLPDAPRKGIVINLAAMRLFYFPEVKDGAPQKVITHPVGIGRVQWKTPEGNTRITVKDENPIWRPTPSIHKEYARNGNPLPAAVPPGPDNPMGTHVLRLAWPTYAIHGTNKPPSIGLRGSFGCIRMYPEDIAPLYNQVTINTPVYVVNQPHLFGWRDNLLYFQTYPVLEDDTRKHDKRLDQLMKTARTTLKSQINARPHQNINENIVNVMIHHPLAVAVPITQQHMTVHSYIDQAQHVQNTLPVNATWSGDIYNEQLTRIGEHETGSIQ